MKSKYFFYSVVAFFASSTIIASAQTACESAARKAKSYASDFQNEKMKETACGDTHNSVVQCASDILAAVTQLASSGASVDSSAAGLGSDVLSASPQSGGAATQYTAAQMKAMRGNEGLRTESLACEAEAKKIDPSFELYTQALKPIINYCKPKYTAMTAKSADVTKAKTQKTAIANKCAMVSKSAQSNAMIFTKNAAIVGGVAAGVGGLAFGLTKALGDDGDDGDPKDAAKKACEKTTGMSFKDGVCKSDSALASCPDGFTKDKDGYCVMTDTTGTAIAAESVTATSKDKGVKIAAPNAASLDAQSDAEKALAALKNSESAAGASGSGASGSGVGALGTGSGSGGSLGSGGGSASGSGSGSGSSYAGSGSGGGESDSEKQAEGAEVKEATSTPLKWRNSKASDRDLPLSRRKRLSH